MREALRGEALKGEALREEALDPFFFFCSSPAAALGHLIGGLLRRGGASHSFG